MGLFRRKPKVTMEEFCREFYDEIFNASIARVDLWKGFCQTAFDLVVEADQSFAAIDRAKFQEELIAIRMELFALAWMHRFKREELTVPQSLFTRRHLEEKGKPTIWDIMGEYNQAVARSTTMTRAGRQLAKGTVVLLNKTRLDMFERWADAVGEKSGTEQREDALKCVARVANRITADIRRPNCILVRLLTARLAARLGCDVNLSPDALFRVAVVICGLYQGAKEAINEANLATS